MHVEVSHPPNYAPWQLAAGRVPVSVPRGAGCATTLLLLVLRRSRIQTWGCFVALRESSLQKAAEEAGEQRGDDVGLWCERVRRALTWCQQAGASQSRR